MGTRWGSGEWSCIFAHNDVQGSITARLLVDDSSLCFLNCHLAAGQEHVRQRNKDLAAILDGGAVFGAGPSLPFINGGDGTQVLDHELVFVRALGTM
jgi:hypothetical protein